jgi:predicted nucleic acid-binding protein
MSHYFMDSSALIKRYIVETGTNWVRSIITPSTRNTIIIAHITQAEIVSGAMRHKRERTITERTAHATRLLVDRHASQEYRVIDLTGQIVQRAEDLLEHYSLRAYDSIQLASAVVSNARFVAAGLSPLTFVSADNRLLAVASAEGLATDDPNVHP